MCVSKKLQRATACRCILMKCDREYKVPSSYVVKYPVEVSTVKHVIMPVDQEQGGVEEWAMTSDLQFSTNSRHPACSVEAIRMFS